MIQSPGSGLLALDSWTSTVNLAKFCEVLCVWDKKYKKEKNNNSSSRSLLEAHMLALRRESDS